MALDPFSPSDPDDVGDRADVAPARSDWQTVADELIAAALRRHDATVLRQVITHDLDLLSTSRLSAHAEAIGQLPPGALRDAALAMLGIAAWSGHSVAPTQQAVTALLTDDPALAASLATAAAAVLEDRGSWADAAWFIDAARAGIDGLRAAGAPSSAVEERWFPMMAVSVIAEWNTFSGDEALRELTDALAAPRSRNLLRGYHASALVALGHVLAARGEFGAAAVSVARGVPLLPERSSARAGANALLALVKYRQGDWRGARLAASLVSDVHDPELPSTRALVAAVATLEPATGGDFATAQRRVAEASRALAARPSILAATILLHARLALVIGANDWTGMIQLLGDAEEPGYRRIYSDHEWRALWAMALRNSGRLDAYRDHLTAWSSTDGSTDCAYYWAHLALLAQIDDDPAAALAAARQAREQTRDADDPLGRTWTRIVIGTIVSLYGDQSEGIQSYEAARAELAEMGADGFVRLCTRIIEGTAADLARAHGNALKALTPQQRRIAGLVAEGYTSAEIGQILYLSKKTIDFHVANIVTRLGLASRRELKRRYAALTSSA